MRSFIYIILPCIVLLAGCNKQPGAAFTSDKSLYYAGETIYLKNGSTDAKGYRWDFPDGSSSNEKDATYFVRSDNKGEPVKITLNAFSNKGKKTSTASKSFLLSQPILPGDHYGTASKTSLPFKKTLKADNSQYKLILTENYKDPTEITYKLTINFKNNRRPSPGVYTTSEIDFYLENEFGQGNVVNYALTVPEPGDSITVSHAPEGKIRLKFDHIKIAFQRNTSGNIYYDHLSGDVTF